MPESLNIKLERGGSVPFAEQIYNSVLRSMLLGDLVFGSKLPAERDLAEYLNISRGTVKRAYARLSDVGAIEIRQGSGSYVLKNGSVLEANQKKESLEVIAASFRKLESMGITRREILNLINIYCEGSDRKNRSIKILVLSNNLGILSELEQQFAYLADSNMFSFSLSFMTTGSIKSSRNPETMLEAYDLIIASCIDYPLIASITPGLMDRILKVYISPTMQTLTQLSALSKSSILRIIYRTPIYLDFVRRTLLSLGFSELSIYDCQEDCYNPRYHDEDGVSVLLNHNESPVYTNKEFERRNKEFEDRGGSILQIHYRIERNSLLEIEDRIHLMLKGEIAKEK